MAANGCQRNQWYMSMAIIWLAGINIINGGTVISITNRKQYLAACQYHVSWRRKRRNLAWRNQYVKALKISE